jgi:hypothetical protein
VSGDGFVSPLDPLLVINFLNDPLNSEAESLAKSTESDVRSSPLFYPVAQPLAPLPSRSASSIVSDRLPPLGIVAGPTLGSPTTAGNEQAHDVSQRNASLGHRATDDRDLVDALFATFDDWINCGAGTN